MGSPWTPVELAVLRDLYADMPTAAIAKALGRSEKATYLRARMEGLRKSPALIAEMSRQAMRDPNHGGRRAQFVAGQPAWNKGLKGVVGVQEACRATQFKKGRPAHEARNYLPIGSLRVSKDGYLERKVTDDPSIVPARRWVGVHRLVWEAANGPTPAGRAVAFLPGQRTAVEAEITLDRLECVSRVELMRRNSVHTKYPPELARLAQLRGAITRQINKRAKHEQEHQ